MPDTNWTLELVKLIPTTVIGGIAVYIAFAQWRTAHQKVVLDLFDRRMRVYEGALQTAHQILSRANATAEDIRSLHRARSDAGFLFGREINQRLDALIKDAAAIGAARSSIEGMPPGDERSKWLRAQHDAILRVNGFSEEIAGLCRPYMLMDQKLAHRWRWPWSKTKAGALPQRGCTARALSGPPAPSRPLNPENRRRIRTLLLHGARWRAEPKALPPLPGRCALRHEPACG